MRTKAPVHELNRAFAARVRVAVIRAEYNASITESLENACVDTLHAAGVPASRVSRFSVPGCFEIPIMAKRLALRKRYDVIVALGAVVRGDTYHFELVANECARGVMDVSLSQNIPIIFEVLAVYRRRDASRRAGNNVMNKGIEAATTALTTLARLKSLK